MSRVGTYIETPVAEFIEWLEAWTQQGYETACGLGQGRIVLGAARRRVLLSQRLVMEVPGTLSGIPDIPEDMSCLVSFQVLPVGLGSSIEVIFTSDTPDLLPYLVELVTAASARWPVAAANAWFGEPPCRPIELCHLRVATTVPTIERELARFASGFATAEIGSVSFLPPTYESVGAVNKQAQPARVNWEFRLSLHTDASWQGIDRVALTCDIARPSGKQPLMLALRCHGHPYKEIAPFTAGLIAFCRSRWTDTQVLCQADRTGIHTPLNSPTKPSIGDQATRKYWTLADRPWEMVTDVRWDRLLVELWWKDYSSAAIARRIGVIPRTVINRLSALRKIYGTGIIPTETHRRGRGNEKSVHQ